MKPKVELQGQQLAPSMDKQKEHFGELSAATLLGLPNINTPKMFRFMNKTATIISNFILGMV